MPAVELPPDVDSDIDIDMPQLPPSVGSSLRGASSESEDDMQMPGLPPDVEYDVELSACNAFDEPDDDCSDGDLQLDLREMSQSRQVPNPASSSKCHHGLDLTEMSQVPSPLDASSLKGRHGLAEFYSPPRLAPGHDELPPRLASTSSPTGTSIDKARGNYLWPL